jgi:cytochrome b involved in lipid metabolism
LLAIYLIHSIAFDAKRHYCVDTSPANFQPPAVLSSIFKSTATMSKQYTKAEVAQHKDEKAMFIIIDDGVYDVAGMCFFSAFCL